MPIFCVLQSKNIQDPTGSRKEEEEDGVLIVIGIL